MGQGGEAGGRAEKCNTLRQNLTTQQENRTGHSDSGPVLKDRGGGGGLPSSLGQN